MSTASPLKISERLVSFAQTSETDHLASSLDKLAVFHQNFSDELQAHEQENFGKTYEQGFEEGMAQGRAAALAEEAQQQQNIVQLLQALQNNMLGLGENIQASHRRAVAGALRAVLPKLAAQSTGAEIAAFITQISGQALRGNVTLFVNPEFEAQLEIILGAVGNSTYETPSFTIKHDPALAGSALKAVWQSGGGEIDIDGALSNCLALIDKENLGG